MTSPKMGRAMLVKNKGRKARAAEEYYSIKIEFENGNETYILLTRFEMGRALERADRNPEDVAKVSKLRNLID